MTRCYSSVVRQLQKPQPWHKSRNLHGIRHAVSVAEGLRHESAIQCEGLMSLDKSRLTDYVGELTTDKLRELDIALLVALGIPTSLGPPA